MTTWKATKYPGIRYKVTDRKFRGRAEKYYSIRYKRHGKSIEEGIGWESAGISSEYCSQLRSKIITNIRTGQGYQSLREKRDNKEMERRAKAEAKKAELRENTPFDTLAQHYLDWSENNKASWKEDESRYRLHIRPHLGTVPIKQIGILHLERMKKAIQKKGKSAQTILHCLSLVRAMYNRAPGWGLYNGPNPIKETSKVDKKFLKIPDSSRLRFFIHEEAKILLDELKTRSPQLHDISLLSLHTGIRAGEIFSLLWADVDLQNEIVTIRNPKNDEIRRVYMTPQVKEMFRARRPDKPRINALAFTNRNGEKLREVSNLFDRVMAKLKFNEGITDRRDRLVFHSLRHTYGSWLAMQGTTILVIKELLGHKKIEMTMRYAHLLPDHKKESVLQLAENQSKAVIELDKKRKKK